MPVEARFFETWLKQVNRLLMESSAPLLALLVVVLCLLWIAAIIIPYARASCVQLQSAALQHILEIITNKYASTTREHGKGRTSYSSLKEALWSSYSTGVSPLEVAVL